ncbi:MAG: lysophospholipid acyltransferase family protein [Candidatus Omnitrophota bacterium]
MLYSLYRIGRYMALMLPLKACYAAAVFLADIYYLFARRDKIDLEYNLTIVLGKKDKKLIRRYIRNVFRNFAKYLADFFRFSKLNRDFMLSRITVEGKENLDKALAKGNGLILVAAHMGNWELGAAIVASLGYPLYVIALDHKDKRINDFFLEQRAVADVKVIPVGAQLKNCFRILRKNNLLAIAGDRVFSDYGVSANFFGRKAYLPKGTAFFSLKTGAAIIPTFTLRRKDDTFKMVFEQPIESAPGVADEAGIKGVMQRYLPVIEKYIRSYPDQWYAFRKMWQE